MTNERVRVTLVEVPAVAVELDGDVLGEVVLNHPKYSQLLLAANLRAQRSPGVEFDVDFVDLKAAEPRQISWYRTIDYDGQSLNCFRVGAPLESARSRFVESDLVGISANFTYERRLVVETIRFIRENATNAVVVVGGHDATVSPEYYLNRGAHVCVLGEGESALPDIALALRSGSLASVHGIAIRENGKVHRRGKRLNHRFDQIAFPDADLLRPFRFDQCPDGPFPTGVDPRLAVLETSRGCNERCSFCDSSFVVGRFRSIATDILRSRIAEMTRAGIRTVLFADDNILYRILPQNGGEAGRQELVAFFTGLYEAGFAWTFYNGIQFGLLERDGCLDSELIDCLFRNSRDEGRFRGCFRAYIPLEKFDQDEMARLPKLRSIEVEQAILSAIAERGVPELNLGFIIGSIDETAAKVSEAVSRAEEFGAIVRGSSQHRSHPRFFPWCSVPIPGTPDYRRFHAHIAYPADEFPELFSNYTSVLSTEHYRALDLTRERARIDIALNGGEKFIHKIPLPDSVAPDLGLTL